MPRELSGQVVERTTSRGRVFALRFRAYGRRQYVTLGTSAEGWDRRAAETELQNVLADVRRGLWRPPDRQPVPPHPSEDPTFHEFASEWLESVAPGLAPGTVDRYRWQLTHHLLPHFARRRLTQITVAEVDRYREAKARERRRGDERISGLSAELDEVRSKGASTRAIAAELRAARRG